MVILAKRDAGRKSDEATFLQRSSTYLPGIGRYSAGARIEDALNKMESLAEAKYSSIANILGEHDKDPLVIAQTVMQYCQLIEGINTRKITSPAISLKPTQFGLSFDGTNEGVEIASHHMTETVRLAVSKEIYVWLDMENRFTTDFTLSLYQALCKEYPGQIGIALQANLKRTESDLRRILQFKCEHINVRLVRGIYNEPEEVSYLNREKMHESFARLMGIAFSESRGNFNLSIGTHHPDQIIRALELNKRYPNRLVEFQFLLGAVKRIPEYLKELGHECTFYVPCGPRFIDYGIRRVKENPGGIFGLFASSFYERKNLQKIVGQMSGRMRNRINLD